MTAMTDILQPTPTRGALQTAVETAAEHTKCHSTRVEDPAGYPPGPKTAVEAAAEPSATVSTGAERLAGYPGGPKTEVAGMAERSGGGSHAVDAETKKALSERVSA